MSTHSTTRPEQVDQGDAWALVRAAQAGDRDAFGQLYRQYQPHITRFLRGKLAEPALAEDLTSETFLRALRRIDTVAEQRSNPGAWLSTIARNLVFDHNKSARTRYERATDDVPEPRAARTERIEPEPSERAQARADRAAAAATVARCLEQLTPDQRRAVELADLADPGSVAAAASVMGRGKKAVAGLRSRAVRAMREQLAAEGLTSTAECADAVARAEAAVQRLRHQRMTGRGCAEQDGRETTTGHEHALPHQEVSAIAETSEAWTDSDDVALGGAA